MAKDWDPSDQVEQDDTIAYERQNRPATAGEKAAIERLSASPGVQRALPVLPSRLQRALDRLLDSN